VLPQANFKEQLFGSTCVTFSLTDFKDPREALKMLERRKKELEEEMERLLKKLERGEIGEEEFNERRVKIEREFVEIMDRIVQLRFIVEGGI